MWFKVRQDSHPASGRENAAGAPMRKFTQPLCQDTPALYQEEKTERIERKFSDQRHTEATRQINATLADLVDVERHAEVRRRLLQIIAQASGYTYGLLAEMEPDYHYMRVTGSYIPAFLVQQIERILGFDLVGYRFVNDPKVALQTPPTERFRHLHEWRPDIIRPLALSIETILGIRHIAAIRLHTGQHYLGAATFVATGEEVDLPLLEYFCNNTLVYAIRLMQEQVIRTELQTMRTHELEQEIQERKQAEIALRESEEAMLQLYTITADQALDFTQKVQALLNLGCQWFGLEMGILARIEGERYAIVQCQTPVAAVSPGACFALADTYCNTALAAGGPVSFSKAAHTEWAKHPCYTTFALHAYIGTPVQVSSAQGNYTYGTLNFSSFTPRTNEFRAFDEQFLQLMAQWIGGEIERERTTQKLKAYAHKIEQTNQALAIARDHALEASRLKSEFLTTMSHEIRTPMNSVLGMTELLLDTPLDKQQQEYAKIVFSEGEHLLGIINDILDFSKIEAGKVILEEQPFALIPLVEGVTALLTTQAMAKGLTMTTVIDPALPTLLCGDAGRLRQVLINLLGNAVKFTEKGEIVLQIRPAIMSSTQVELYCTVTDSGIGISESDQHRLFQPFTQVDGGTTRRHGGTGLGLSIAQRLVKLMGGNMGVKSSVGVGTTFWFTVTLRVRTVPDAPTIPLRGRADQPPALDTHAIDQKRLTIALAGNADPLAAASARQTQPQTPATILLVEDQEPNQVLALEQLGKLGYIVELAQNGQEACTRVQEPGTDYALILMDCQMPIMDGFQATEQIRAHETHVGGHTPIIAMTAQAMKHDEERCLAVGMDGYLRKPVRLQELKNALEQWLG